MQLGLSTASTSFLPVREAADHLLAMVRTAAAAGLDSVTFGDHHAVSGARYFQNTPTLARALVEWDDRPAGCLFLLPLWNPVLAAEQVGTVAAFAAGPLIVQAGIGDGAAQFGAMGADLATRGARIDEGLRVMQALLAGESVSSESLGIRDAAIDPIPEQPVDWWVGGGAKVALRRVARFGAAWYVGPQATLDEIHQGAERYRAACETEGVEPRIIVRRDMLVQADGDAARAAATQRIEAGYRGMTLAEVVAGAPADAAAQLAPLAGLDVEQVVARTMGISPATDLETLEALGEVRRLVT